jgi:dTDP-4-amino-4,6-dideoxygalactose transaminase
MGAIQALADRHGLAVIEDAAQAHGSTWQGRAAGAWGKAGCFSFYPTKNMHSLEGGMVTTADADNARTIRLLRNLGMELRYANEIFGANMRLTDVAAAIGREQLKKLAGWNEQRQANAAFLSKGLTGVVTPAVAPEATHVFHQYTIRVRDGRRDEVQAGLTERGIGSAVYYPTPIHLLKPYVPGTHPGNRDWDLPETMRAADEALSLPVWPGLTDDDLGRIVDARNALTEGS